MKTTTVPAALLLSLAGLAGCDLLGPGDDLFDDGRHYVHQDADCVSDNPELPCSASVTFCPDGSADYRGLGSDIVERGSYRVMGPRVRVTLRDSDRRVYFTLSGDEQTLVADDAGRVWERATGGADCTGRS